jgi:hypothetical protein
MRWAIGAIAAVLSSMVFLPGVVSAHHVIIETTISCDEGTFDATIDYFGGDDQNIIIVVEVEGLRFSGAATTGGINTQLHPGVVNAPANWSAPGGANNQFTYSSDRERFEIDSHGGTPDLTDEFDDFMSINGTYDDVVAAGGSVDIEAQMFNAGGGNDAVLDDQPEGVGAPGAGTSPYIPLPPYTQTTTESVTLEDFENCRGEACVDGEVVNGVLVFQGTDDCDPVEVCIDGEVQTVSEFEAEQGDLEDADACVTIFLPPPPSSPPPPTTTTPPVQQVAAAVSEVLPARLPSTGMGPGAATAGVSLVAVMAVTLLSIGGVATMVAKRSRS